MTKPKATLVQSLSHCEKLKCYYFKSNYYTGIVLIDEHYDVLFHGSSLGYEVIDLCTHYPDWQISLEPVPMPEVER